MLQRKDKIDQEKWLGKLFDLTDDMIEIFDKNRTDKREIKELKAKETLKKNSFNVDKKSTRKNSSSKVYTPKEEKNLISFKNLFEGKGVLEKRAITSDDDDENGVYFSPNVKCKKLKTDDNGIRLVNNGKRDS